MTGDGVVALPMAASPDDLEWIVAYDRTSVDQFICEVERERARLQGGIDAARAQVDGLRAARRTSDDLSKAELGDLVFRAREELANLEAEHAKVLATIRRAAEAEASRILTAAAREVAALHASLPSLGGEPDSTPEGSESSDAG